MFPEFENLVYSMRQGLLDIRKLLRSSSKEAFLRDPVLVERIAWEFDVLGMTVKEISRNFADYLDDLDLCSWQTVRSKRSILAHHDGPTDLHRLWLAYQTDFAELEDAFVSFLSSFEAYKCRDDVPCDIPF